MSTNYFVADPVRLVQQIEDWNHLIDESPDSCPDFPTNQWLHIGVARGGQFTFKAYERITKTKRYGVKEALNNSMAWFDYLQAVADGCVTMYGKDHPLAIINGTGDLVYYSRFKQVAEIGRGNTLTVNQESKFPGMAKKCFVDAWGYHFNRGDFR
jgi:hypothetical protein